MSSWASGASTLSSISSSVSTPPPQPSSSRTFSYNATSVNPALVYHPKAAPFTPSTRSGFNWAQFPTPVSSAQTSPASSSSIDIEVEQAMKNVSYTPISCSAPTPSPSPLTNLERLHQDDSDEIDAYIAESLMFFGEGSSQSDGFTNSVASQQGSHSVFETASSKSGVEPAVSSFTELLPVHNSIQSCDKPSHSIGPRPVMIRKAAVKRKTVELYPSTPVEERIAVRRVRTTFAKKTITGASPEAVTLAKPLPLPVAQVPVQKSLVEVDVNEEGTPINFTITPSTPRPTVKPKPKAAVVKPKEPVVVVVEDQPPPKKARASREPSTTKTARKPRTNVVQSDESASSGAKKKGFCIDSIVAKFVQMANNKKLPPATPATPKPSKQNSS